MGDAFVLAGLPDRVRNHALGRVGGVEYDPNDDMAKMIAAGSKHFAASLPQPAPLNDDQLQRLIMPTYLAIAQTTTPWLEVMQPLAGRDCYHAGRSRCGLTPLTRFLMQAKEELDARLKSFWATAEAGG